MLDKKFHNLFSDRDGGHRSVPWPLQYFTKLRVLVIFWAKIARSYWTLPPCWHQNNRELDSDWSRFKKRLQLPLSIEMFPRFSWGSLSITLNQFSCLRIVSVKTVQMFFNPWGIPGSLKGQTLIFGLVFALFFGSDKIFQKTKK